MREERPQDPEESSALESAVEEVRELPAELAGAATAIREDIEATWAGRLAIGAARWLVRRTPKSRRGRIIAFVAAFVFVMVPSAALLVFTLTVDKEAAEDWFAALGYPGVFLANLLSTATVFLPVPGLTAVAQALIISEGDILDPFAVGMLGGLGMGLGETTAYLTGFAGAEIARETEMKAPRWLQPVLDRVIRVVEWLMQRYGLPTLFVLSVIPDPIFEFAGITAGATRMGFRKFMLVVVAGNCLRGLLVVYFGEKLLPF